MPKRTYSACVYGSEIRLAMSEVLGDPDEGDESDPILMIAIFAVFGLLSGRVLGALGALLLRRSPQPSRR